MRVRLMPLGTIATLAAGERLLDALDQLELPVLPIACRSANCGICTVIVRGDATGLAPPNSDEQRFLAGLRIAANQRLGCQIHAAPDATDQEVTLEILSARK
jgi:ferredoxin